MKKRMIFGTLVCVTLLLTFCNGSDESQMQYFHFVDMPLSGMVNASCEYDVTKLLESMGATVLSISAENGYVRFKYSLRESVSLSEIENALAADRFRDIVR